jgi:hypothetical protein
MKVLDLHCQHGHSFEGWFGSEDDFQSQLARGLVECPICGNASITKKLSAPRLNLSGARAEPSSDASLQSTSNAIDSGASCAVDTRTNELNSSKNSVLQAMAQDPQFQAAYLHMARKIMANTEDVGTGFAEEARKIHYGETPERGIRGHASQEETMELLEEGIEVMPLILPAALKEPLQ